MELMPVLRIGWLNGWLPFGLLALTEGILFLAFPKAVVRRLFDRSGWRQSYVIWTVIGKLVALVCLALIVATPLKIGSTAFIIGMIVVGLGLVGLIKALFDFRDTPPDDPVAQGLYKISRHPQIVMSSLVLLGSCLAIGSWLALLLLLGARICGHFGILGEEEVCLERYGDAYGAYMERVPRYLFF